MRSPRESLLSQPETPMDGSRRGRELQVLKAGSASHLHIRSSLLGLVTFQLVMVHASPIEPLRWTPLRR